MAIRAGPGPRGNCTPLPRIGFAYYVVVKFFRRSASRQQDLSAAVN
jgi:hypothetical protein